MGDNEHTLVLSVEIPFYGHEEEAGKIAERFKQLLHVHYAQSRVFYQEPSTSLINTNPWTQVHLKDRVTGEVHN